jgi:hypothetical protein
MRTWTRDQYNESWRRWYEKNSARKTAWQQWRREAMRQWWRDQKATKCCVKCGESTPECLHFHHRDPSQKEINLGNIASNGQWSKERILEEVAKCDVLCANCHMKHHWEERKLSSG